MELVLAPLMFPVATGYAVLCHFHRQSSRYTPNIVSMEEGNLSTFAVTVDENGKGKIGYQIFDEDNWLCFAFEGSRASKGMFTLFKYNAETGKRTSAGSVSVGIWSKFHIFKPDETTTLDETTQFALGSNKVRHESDAIDNYRVFELSDSNVYQWSKRGKALERVYNLGQKDSEVRERLAVVGILPGNKGYRITLDKSKISCEVALMTSLISFLDQWNTMLGIGGIYFPVKHGELPWRRV